MILEGLLSALPDIVYVSDSGGYLKDWNKRVTEVTGYAEEEIGQMNLLDLLPLHYHEQLTTLRRQIFEEAAPTAVEAAILTKAGTEIPHEFSGAGIRNEEGRVVAFVGIGRDISKRKLLEKEEREVSRQDRQWVAGELHDGTCQQLSTLSVLIATLELLLGEVNTKIRSLLSRIRVLLDQSIQQTRALTHRIAPIDFEEVCLSEALTSLTAETSAAYEIDCTFSNDAGVEIENPEAAMNLYRIAQEALRNAIRHGKAGRISLALCQDGDEVTLSIADNGAGISEELVACEEERGLGLKNMHYRARVMGGTLHIKANSDGGTVVRCAIPSYERLRHA